MKNKLISMTDFVLKEYKNYKNIETTQNNFDNIRIISLAKITQYANFLKQPLKLGMFVPCDDENKIYKSYLSFSHGIDDKNGFICEPYEGLFEIDSNKKCCGWKYLDPDKTRCYDAVSYEEANLKYQQAKDRVLFNGFELVKEYESVWTFRKEGLNYEFNIVKDCTIEELQQNFVGDEILLTASAIKQFEI